MYKIGSSQFVRLPEDFRFESMLEFDINETGSTVSIRPAIHDQRTFTAFPGTRILPAGVAALLNP